jgi:protein-S-isoprenylcysteine O-methyltransferase Ste14
VERCPDRLGPALVGAQAVSAAAVLWPGRARWRLPRPARSAALGAVLAGGALSLAGVRALGVDLTPFVDPRPGAELRTTGVYQLSRNPIYAGLLLGVCGFSLLRRRPEPLVAAAALAAVLHVKAGVEERRLTERYGAAYTAYAARTPRLVGRPRR